MGNKTKYQIISGLNVFISGANSQRNELAGKVFNTTLLSNIDLTKDDKFLGRGTYRGHVVEYEVITVVSEKPGKLKNTKVYEVVLQWRYVHIDSVDLTELKRIDPMLAAQLRIEAKNSRR